MIFEISASAFVLGEYIAADVRNIVVKEFKSDLDLDNIGPRWKPLDDEARDALVRLDALARQRQADGGVEKPVGKSGKVVPIESPVFVAPAGSVKTPDTMSEAQRPLGRK